MSDEKRPNREREQTDESLRAERERVDRALGEQLVGVDETADEVISKARARADRVLATARARSDRRARPVTARASASVQRERILEDEALREERADADETLREERAQHLAFLSTQREDTDEDLFNERAQSDDSLATRDAFLGIVGHDLRTILNVMTNFAALIESGLSEANAVEQMHAKRIQRSAARMNRLLGDLLDVASIEAGMLAVTRELSDPRQVVSEAVDIFQEKALASGTALTIETALPPLLVAFVSARIFQVLVNLLSNAIKFTPAGGRVVVRLERVGEELRFAVSDTGIGIHADKLDSIFERFRQVVVNDRRGMGLGLYISKCIVQGHGGRIWAESGPGNGSTFCFTLPSVLENEVVGPAAARDGGDHPG